MRPALTLVIAAATLVLTACGGSDDGSTPDTSEATEPGEVPDTSGATEPGEQRFPDVVDVEPERADDGTWTFRVTISSPYDTPERYADGWRVLGPDGTVYGEHELAHDHANEQPFTRTQRGVSIPDGITTVTIEGRDQRFGYGGTSLSVTLAGN